MYKRQEVTDAAARLAVTAVMIINMVLTMKGRNPLPFDENTLTESLSAAMAAAAVIWSWWKNNNLTVAASVSQQMLRAVKEDGIPDYEEDGMDNDFYGEDGDEG